MAAGAAKGADRVVPLEVTVNGANVGTWLLVERAGALYAPRDALEEWRVVYDPNAARIQFRGQDYWPLASVPGYRSKINYSTQSLELLFSPEAFAATRMNLRLSTKLSVSPAEPAVFLNYDMSVQRTNYREAPTLDNVGVLAEVGVSSDLGVLTTTMRGQHVTDKAVQGNQRSFLRLETTLTKDFPDSNKTLTIGDTATRPGVVGTSVYFGGIKFGSNFNLTPGFIYQPLPVLTGVSTVPSTVDLYINDILRQTSKVPAGPFTIDNLPVLTGSGEARMVVRDLLGRETVISQSFFSSSRLLAPGLDDWSVEAGKVRLRLGQESSDYGPGFGRAIWRRGISSSLTLEGVAAASSKTRYLEVAATAALPGQLLGNAALAGSQYESLSQGRHWLVGVERQGLNSSIFLQAQGASADFRAFGQDIAVTPTKQQYAANWTYGTERFGSIGLGYASSRLWDALRVNTASANYSVNVGYGASLNLTASRTTGDYSGSNVGLVLVMPWDRNRTLSASATRSEKGNESYVTASQGPTEDSNLGWRVLAGRTLEQGRAEGGLYYFGRYGQLNADVSSTRDQSALRLSGAGGLVMADGHLFATQRSNQSLAIVEVAGYGNVGVGFSNTMITRTDAAGIAMLPQLIPYQRNFVRLNSQDLPVSAEIDSIEQVVVPGWRNVIKVVFPVRSGRGALLRIVFDDGQDAPAGALVGIVGDKQDFYVARRGEAFVTGLKGTDKVWLEWNGQRCEFEVVLPPGTPDDIPRLGPLYCKGVAR